MSIFPRLGWITTCTLLTLLLSGCLMPQTDAARTALFTPTLFATATQTPVPPTLTATQTPTFTAIPSPTSTPEPAGCQKPPEDYTQVEVNNGWTINQRTLAMLTHAQELYGGEIEISGYAITQGSYHDNGSYSFGTHLGGGAVDLSVMRRGTYTVLWEEVEPLLRALRAAGFAAWLREYGEVYADSAIHIHAIAIGDRELSAAAQDQLTGPAGYFRGYSGLPFPDGGTPTPDRYGGPILCQWMIDLGYRDLR
ncbi:MAG: hypothetical protein EHM33_16760 [Chloroflexi bacterium]|nr:MAG: hypothetical protein EHM33_16760 [Chloroflexota bacterium]